ncbi:hypothetical protein JMUB7526_28650 [Staphylococcus aureus]
MAQEVIKIRGGRTLNGEVNISGAKNSAVAIIPATLLAQGLSLIHISEPTRHAQISYAVFCLKKDCEFASFLTS